MLSFLQKKLSSITDLILLQFCGQVWLFFVRQMALNSCRDLTSDGQLTKYAKYSILSGAAKPSDLTASEFISAVNA